ncbi:kinase-like protein [Rhodocollybia butyracea]|uniref:Kinase-like protein n=1 Tax=Rhodocollybia butyracea TaxID=206335 RepID=A0A9P5Q0X8_9AGAR|nr:kinase-like protein [Rhodocollybia butyracea]
MSVTPFSSRRTLVPTSFKSDIPPRSVKRSRNLDICAKLTTIQEGRKDVIGLSLNKPITIGRNPDRCSYVVADTSVSGVHCTIFAVRSQHGGVIVSCQDISKNGIFLNAQRIKKTSVILMDNDLLKLPDSITFMCTHVWKDSVPVDRFSVVDPPPQALRRSTHKHIGRYTVSGQCLGSGSFATVHLAFSSHRRCQVACKSITIKSKKDSEKELDQVMKETRILMGLNHPNINRIYDSEEDPDSKYFHIFLQLCTGGDLFTYINSYGERYERMEEQEVKYIMYQLLLGLKYLHSQHISHRDLKPENILLYAPGPYPRIQIADFGLARPKAWQETFNVCGTVSYLPPEGVLALDQKHLGYVGMPSDCWSAGIILYIMLSGSHPFDYDAPCDSRASRILHSVGSEYHSEESELLANCFRSEAQLKERIIDGQVEFHPSIWHDLHEAKTLILLLLIHDPLKRAKVADALKSLWITKDLNMLENAYRARITASISPAEKL